MLYLFKFFSFKFPVKVFSIFFTTCILTSAFLQAKANEQALSVEYLHGTDDISGTRIAYRPYTFSINKFDWLGEAKLYFEASVGFWENSLENKHDTNFAIAISPVLEKKLTMIQDKYPLFLELGIGASLVRDRKFAGKDIGSHYQFEDRIGFIIKPSIHSPHEFGIRYLHYSNGGLNTKNPGLDFLSATYIRKF